MARVESEAAVVEQHLALMLAGALDHEPGVVYAPGSDLGEVVGGFFEPTGRISRASLSKVVDALKELGDIQPGFATERLFLPEVTELTE